MAAPSPASRRALLDRLLAYDWPGNARELRNTIERATVLAHSGLLRVEHLPPNFGESAYSMRTSTPAAEPHHAASASAAILRAR